jgi:hypothetical protein
MQEILAMSDIGKIGDSIVGEMHTRSSPATETGATVARQGNSVIASALSGLQNLNIRKTFGMENKPTLIVGCGRDGTKWNSATMNKRRHQHGKDGDCTADIEEENHPHLHCDFTQKGVASDPRHASTLDKFGKFSKVKFENFPGHLLGDKDKSEVMADNIHDLTSKKASVEATVGGRSPEIKIFAAALEARGFETQSLKQKKGQYVLKAKKK